MTVTFFSRRYWICEVICWRNKKTKRRKAEKMAWGFVTGAKSTAARDVTKRWYSCGQCRGCIPQSPNKTSQVLFVVRALVCFFVTFGFSKRKYRSLSVNWSSFLSIWVNRQLKQGRQMKIRVSVILGFFPIPRLFPSRVAKRFQTMLALNWYERLEDRTSPTQLQNGAFHVAEWTKTASKCTKMKNARGEREKLLLFIVKYANL